MRLVLTLMIGLALAPAFATPASAKDDITATDAWRQAQAGKLTIVDVRSPAEWRETGVAKGAWTITIHGRERMTGFLKQLLARTGGDRSRRISLICATGVRSDYTLRFLRRNGFTNVSHIAEGMMGRSVFRGGGKGWLKHRLPLAKP